MSYYASYQPDPRRNITGIVVVLALHVIVVYALVSGLARKVVDVVRAPIEAKVIEEIKETPPPKEVVPPPPVLDTPPPPFVPPPEVTINTVPPAAGITVVTQEPPPVFTPTPPPVVAPPPPPPVAKPVQVAIGVACPTRELPKLTPKQESVSGSVRAKLTIKGGKVTDVEILSSTPRGFFDAAVRSAVLQYGCQTTTEQVVVAEQTFNFVAE